MFAPLLKLAETFCGAGARTRVFEPMVADWQHEFAQSHGVRRWLVAVRGMAAFARSLLMCANPLRRDISPMPSFAIAVGAFAVVATILQAIPVDVRWVHWEWQQVRVLTPDDVSWWFSSTVFSLPAFIAFGIVLAMLPAAMLAVARGVRISRLIGASACALLVFLLLSVWIAPAAQHVRGVRFFERVGVTTTDAERRVAAQEARFNARITDNRPTFWRITWARTRMEVRQIGLGLALGVLGIALARVRLNAQAAFTLRAVAGWWMVGWTAYLLLRYWASPLQWIVPVPRWWMGWLPQVVLLIIALVALRTTRGGAARDCPG